MKGKLLFDVSDRYKKTSYYFEENLMYGDNDYLIQVCLPSTNKFDYRKIKEGFYKFLIRKLNSKQYLKDYPDRYKLIKDCLENNIDLLDNCEIDFSDIESNIYKAIIKYCDNDMTFCFNNPSYPITMEGYMKACEEHQKHNNVKIKIDGNEELITLDEYRKTVEIIDNIVNEIKSLNLSPFEEIIYAFDYTKNRFFNKEECGENARISRDLTRVLLGDKIVCEGYAVLFSTILQRLGYQASKYMVKTSRASHAICIAKIKDEKYDLDGIYFFDPTWDAKYNSEEKNSDIKITINRYSHCGNYHREDRYEDITFGEMCSLEDEKLFSKIINHQPLNSDEMKRVNGFVSMLAFDNGITELQDYRTGQVYYDEKYNVDKFLENFDKEKFKEFRHNFIDKFWTIDNKTLFRAIYNVRKYEYYNHPEEFSFSDGDFYEIINNFNKYPKWGDYNYNDDCSRFIDEKQKDILQLRLTKVLSNIRNKKNKISEYT